MFHSFDLTFFPFAIEKKGLCDLTLPFVKTIGPEVYKGEILIMLVSKVTVAIRAWVFCCLTRRARLFVPTNLATNLWHEEKVGCNECFEKEEVFIPLLAPR